MSEKFNLGDKFGARAKKNSSETSRLGVDGYWTVVCRGPDGRVKWTDDIHNIITNVGLDNVLDVWLSDLAADATHYIGLTDGTPSVAAGDTMASHAGWAEVTAYDESVRQTWGEGGASSQSITNSTAATFTIDTNSTTVGGAFLATSSTKGETASKLICVGAFTAGDKSLDDNDTLDVTLTITASDQ